MYTLHLFIRSHICRNKVELMCNQEISTHILNDLTSLDITTMRKLKKIRNSLLTLLRFTDDELSSFSALAVPRIYGQGVDCLSDDILGLIFNFAHDLDSNIGRILLAVNRRFLNVAMNQGELWAVLSNEMHSSTIRKYLSRTQGAGLHVKLFGYPRANCFPIYGILTILVPFVHRWTKLEVVCSNELELQTTISALRASSTISSWWLDSLHTLVIDYPDVCIFDTAAGDDIDMQFYRFWDLPKLKHVSVRNAVPNTCIARSLVTFETSFSWFNTHAVNMNPLLLFLAAAENLRHLSLSFNNSETLTLDCPQIELARLESLHLSIKGRTTTNVLRLFLRIVQMPHLDSMSVEIKLFLGTERVDWMRTLFLSDNDYYTHLTKFEIKILKDDYLVVPLDILLENLYNVQDITICAPDISPPERVPKDKFHNLRSLTFNRCHKFDIEFLNKLTNILPEDKNQYKIKIERCSSLDKEDVLRALPQLSGPLEWK